MLLESTSHQTLALVILLTAFPRPLRALASVQATTGLSATQDVDMAEAPSESALPADVMAIIEETNSRYAKWSAGVLIAINRLPPPL